MWLEEEVDHLLNKLERILEEVGMVVRVLK